MVPYTNSNMILTPNEQLAYRELMKRRVCSLKELLTIFNNYDSTRSIMSRLVKKGYALRVHQGVYAGIPTEYLDQGCEVDRYLVSHIVGGSNGTIAFHSALELHGVANSYFNTVYYMRKGYIRPFMFQGVEYQFINTKYLFGIMHVIREGISVPLTDKERTILDCFRMPEYCGGLEESIKSIMTFNSIDEEKMDRYLNLFGSPGLTQRIGFILSYLKDHLSITDNFLNSLRSSVTKKTFNLVPGKGSTGNYVKEWNLIIPNNFEEVMRFV
jgi:predicted transcriptional regulator of viral defense system